MNDWNVAPGAEVVDETGEVLGVVEQVDATDPPFLLVRTHREGHAVRVPVTVIDPATSTPDRIVVPDARAALTTMGGDLGVETGAAPDAFTIPLAAEEAIANVREVEQGRAVIEKRVETVPHVARIDIGADEVDVERVPMDLLVDDAPSARQEGDTIIVPVIEEVLVVTKRYRVREEVRVTRRRNVTRETLHEELKREVVEIREERYDDMAADAATDTDADADTDISPERV